MALSTFVRKHSPIADSDFLPLLGLAIGVQVARQLGHPDEDAFARLVHRPSLVSVEPATPIISQVTLVTERPELTDQYDFEPPALRSGTVRMFAVPGKLPAIDWEY